MSARDTAASNKPWRSWQWFVRVEALECMEPAQLRKQIKARWIMLGGALFTLLFLFSVYLMPTTSGWHIGNTIALAIQTAIVIFNVIGLVKVKAYVRRRMSGRNI